MKSSDLSKSIKMQVKEGGGGDLNHPPAEFVEVIFPVCVIHVSSKHNPLPDKQ